MKKTVNNYWLLFIGVLGFTFSSCGCDGTSSDVDEPVKPPVEEESDVAILVTKNDRSLDLAKQGASLINGSPMTPLTVTIDPSVRYQVMDGFGAAITGSACYNLMKMTTQDRTKFLKETFSHSEGLGYSYVRISIGCSDFSLSEYTCCDQVGIENFSLSSEELNLIIPVLKEIIAINPQIKIMGTPWTSPRWMKVNNLTDLSPYNSWTGGQLNPKYYADYGTYFVKWIQAMESKGIPIYSVTVQNEPLNRGNSASLFMGWEEQLAFLKLGLGPKLKNAGLKTKVYLFDHNYNYDNMSDQDNYPLKVYADEQVNQYAAGAAYHNYGGVKSELLDIHEQAPDKELVFTETSIGTWNDGRNLSLRLMDDMEEVALGTVNNWCKAVIVWNLMLDAERGPNRIGGCQTCYGAVDINSSDYKTIIKNSHYYIIGHLSSVVKPGATRIGTKGYTEQGIVYSAFQNTDGSYAFVILNKTDARKKISISTGTEYFSYEVPSKSVVSYRWKTKQ